jgi:uncharacterized membrane protein
MARAATKPGPAARGPARKPAAAAKSKRAQPRRAAKKGARAASNGGVGKGASGASKGAHGVSKGAHSVTDTARSVTKAARPSSLTGRLAAMAARKGMKMVGRTAMRAAAHALQVAADKSAELGKTAVDSGMSKRLPIQVSVDVAVPLEVAWDEWLGSGFLPEGVHRVRDIERDGSHLTGVVGPRGADWEAEIVDEREHESLAWRSTVGSDCAGLATFHRLSDRLTRIELDLDVLPTNPAEAFAFSTHIAHHRAEADLRRFKARVEFINPDVYEDVVSRNGDAPDQERED